MSTFNLTITVPRYDCRIIEDVIKNLKATLVYLETPSCRENMPEEQRRAEVKRITELFRNAIKMRHDTMEVDPLYA
jgi:hypothetical protein